MPIIETLKDKRQVATVVIVDQNKILILKRSKISSSPGLWNFPGGSVEKGETIAGAAVREVKEESNLEILPKDMRYLGYIIRGNLQVHIFVTDVFLNMVKINHESDDFDWVSLDEIEDYPFVGPKRGGKINLGLKKDIERYIKKNERN